MDDHHHYHHLFLRRSLLLFLLLLACGLPFAGHAQRDNIWALGAGARLTFNGPTVTAGTSAISSNEAAATVCDAAGNLLFYTDGSQVWDRNDQLMPGGQALLTDPALPPLPHNMASSYTASTAQGAVVVPFPNDPDRYYIFSLTEIELGQPYVGRLYYSVLDMRLNGGLGDIVPAQKGILLDSLLTEGMRAVMGDRCNMWLVVAPRVYTRQTRAFKAYEITDNGLNPVPVFSPIGGTLTDNYELTTIDISPDRRRLAVSRTNPSLTGGNYPLELFDFDPATGIVSGGMLLSPAFGKFGNPCFSPNSRLLYVWNGASWLAPVGVYQYDLSSGNAGTIQGSRILIDPDGGNMRRAGNGRIYYMAGNGLSVITFPDRPGLACQPVAQAVQPAPGTFFPAFNLPSEVPYPVRDTLLQAAAVQAPCFGGGGRLALTASATAGWDYSWNTGATTTRILPDTPGTYYVTYHMPPCSYRTDTFRVSFPDGVLPRIAASAGCRGAANGMAYAYTYAADTVTYHYTWQSPQGTVLSRTDTLRLAPPGTYTLRITTARCDTTLTLTIPATSDTASFLAAPFACAGLPLTLRQTSTAGLTRYFWDFGDGAGTATAQHPSYTYTRPGTYTIRLIAEGAACADTAYSTITVDAPQDGRFTQSPDSICTGKAVTFTPAADSTATSRRWTFGDGTADPRPGDAPVAHAYDKAGLMPVTHQVQYRACPATTFTDTVYVYAYPQVSLGPDTALCPGGGAAIALYNRLAVPPGYAYRWGDGSTAPGLTAAQPGTYSLTVTAPAAGCSTTDSVTIRRSCYLDIPNAFTPNADGLNDYFFPRPALAGNLVRFHMQVYNRWGEVVFETDRTDGRGWDGRFNGVDQPAGVYIYSITAALDGAVPEQYRGNVTLAR